MSLEALAPPAVALIPDAALAAITPVILTMNEAPNIGRVLDRLRWAQRIVVVDSGSTDATLDILARWRNVDVVHRAFDDHTTQWNYGLRCVETEWALTLDADYLLDDAFAGEMARIVTAPAADGYAAAVRYCVDGEPLRGSLYPPRVILFRVARGHYEADGHTQRLRIDGSVAQMTEPLLHDDRKPLSAWFAAQARYAALEAVKLARTDRRELSFADRVRRLRWVAPIVMLPYCLFAKGLILDGKRGLFYALQRTYAELALSLRLFDAE